ncbi:unnamed protein product, partial [Adineta ricciae]
TKTSIQLKTILNPTQSQYVELEQRYFQTFSCSCSSISMPYSTIITIQPEYHQICSSFWISTEWVNYILQSKPSTVSIYNYDYRMHVPRQLSALAMFCQQAKQTINEA